MIGILGGGQLSAMLVEAGITMGLDMGVLSESKADPAVLVGARWFDSASATHKKNFLAASEIVLIESEWAPLDLLAKANKHAPSVRALKILSNKYLQKKLLKTLDIPTAPFSLCNASTAEDFESWLNACLKSLGPALVLKWDRFGYDGKGNCFVGTKPKESPKSRLKRCVGFFEEGRRKGAAVYAEQAIPFKREAALVAVRASGKSSGWANYPLVWTRQEKGVCHTVWGPATAFGLPVHIEKQAIRHAKKIASTLKLCGTFAIEWFWTPGKPLMVNEIAPRVHNSGHWTQDAAQTSQFENHLRACLGWPLGSTRTSKTFGMSNVLGKRSRQFAPGKMPQRWLLHSLRSGGFPHWYGKRDERPGRKMGHTNFDSVRALRYFQRLL